MHCPFCRHEDSRVVDSRLADDGTAVRRRRQCTACERRFTTVETASLAVIKRGGSTEPFSRAKVLDGVRKACQGRPVTEDDLARLAQGVEEAIRATGAAEIDAHEVGLAVLPLLRAIDEVAYLRFASVYRSYDSLEDFEHEIALLRAEHSLADVEAGDADTVEPRPDTVDVRAAHARRAPDSTSTSGATSPAGSASTAGTTSTRGAMSSAGATSTPGPDRAPGPDRTQGPGRTPDDQADGSPPTPPPGHRPRAG